LLAPAAMLLTAVALQAAASAANSWLLGGVALDLVRDLRRRLYGQLQRMPLAWFDRTPTGAIMSRLMDDVSVVQGLASGQTLVILMDVATAAAASVWLTSRSWRLAVALGALAPLYVLIFRLYTRRIHAGTLDVRRQLDQVFGHLKQKIDGIMVVRATAGEAAEVAEFARQITALHEPRLRVNGMGIAFSNLCVGVGGIGATVVFAVGAYEVLAGRMTAGELIAASALAGMLFTPITRLSELATVYQQASASLGRLGEILDCPLAAAPAGVHLFDAESAPPGATPAVAGCVEFDKVSFHYDSDRPVIRNVSLAIEPGSKVAIVGPTGSGKSTLMNLLLRFYDPTAGEIRLDGRPLGELAATDLREHLGAVPQEAIVFRGTLADNIRYGTPHATDEEVAAAARAALVDELARELPQRYDTLVGEGGHPLSQGERQRIAIARLFCKNPSVVVLDEATSSLDRASEALVQEALDRLLARRTTLIIAHRLSTIQSADQIVVMDQGRVVQVGTHAQLLAQEGGMYRMLHDCQFGAAGGQSSRPRLAQPLAAPDQLEPVPA
jgi:subfamily B ATP-binding cassette protein MsbA